MAPQVRYDAAFEEMMVLIVSGIFREVDARLEEAMKEFSFKGAWMEGRKYQKRNLVSMGGAIYLCATSTTERPGASNDWALLVPKPRDGRDGEPRTARSERSSQDVVVRRR